MNFDLFEVLLGELLPGKTSQAPPSLSRQPVAKALSEDPFEKLLGDLSRVSH
jgi:hypothetical protein